MIREVMGAKRTTKATLPQKSGGGSGSARSMYRTAHRLGRYITNAMESANSIGPGCRPK
jgi:hypothetical protein